MKNATSPSRRCLLPGLYLERSHSAAVMRLMPAPEVPGSNPVSRNAWLPWALPSEPERTLQRMKGRRGAFRWRLEIDRASPPHLALTFPFCPPPPPSGPPALPPGSPNGGEQKWLHAPTHWVLGVPKDAVQKVTTRAILPASSKMGGQEWLQDPWRIGVSEGEMIKWPHKRCHISVSNEVRTRMAFEPRPYPQ